MNTITIVVVGLIVLIGGLYIIVSMYYKEAESRGNEISKLKASYDAALKSGNKREALEAGRKYYAAQRTNKTLTIYDEQALSNDISAM